MNKFLTLFALITLAVASQQFSRSSQSQPFTESQRTALTQAVNNYRAKLNNGHLKGSDGQVFPRSNLKVVNWSDALSQQAQDAADACRFVESESNFVFKERVQFKEFVSPSNVDVVKYFDQQVNDALKSINSKNFVQSQRQNGAFNLVSHVLSEGVTQYGCAATTCSMVMSNTGNGHSMSKGNMPMNQMFINCILSPALQRGQNVYTPVQSGAQTAPQVAPQPAPEPAPQHAPQPAPESTAQPAAQQEEVIPAQPVQDSTPVQPEAPQPAPESTAQPAAQQEEGIPAQPVQDSTPVQPEAPQPAPQPTAQQVEGEAPQTTESDSLDLVASPTSDLPVESDPVAGPVPVPSPVPVPPPQPVFPEDSDPVSGPVPMTSVRPPVPPPQPVFPEDSDPVSGPVPMSAPVPPPQPVFPEDSDPVSGPVPMTSARPLVRPPQPVFPEDSDPVSGPVHMPASARPPVRPPQPVFPEDSDPVSGPVPMTSARPPVRPPQPVFPEDSDPVSGPVSMYSARPPVPPPQPVFPEDSDPVSRPVHMPASAPSPAFELPLENDPVEGPVPSTVSAPVPVAQPAHPSQSNNGMRPKDGEDQIRNESERSNPNSQPVDGDGAFTQAENDAILAAHNTYRQQLAAGDFGQNNNVAWPKAQQPMPNLQWNDAHAQFAAQYLEKCQWKHSSSEERGARGENLFSSTWKADPAYVVKDWVSEGRNQNAIKVSAAAKFNGSSNRAVQVGHFTQVVWQATTEVGCARRFCSNFQNEEGRNGRYIVSCVYSPQGNVLGQPIYK